MSFTQREAELAAERRWQATFRHPPVSNPEWLLECIWSSARAKVMSFDYATPFLTQLSNSVCHTQWPTTRTLFRRWLLGIAIVTLLVNRAWPQSGWFWQNPLPQGNSLWSVAALDENTMIAVGATCLSLQKAFTHTVKRSRLDEIKFANTGSI